MAGLTLADILGRATPDLINYPPQGTVQGAFDRYGRPIRSRFGSGGGVGGATLPGAASGPNGLPSNAAQQLLAALTAGGAGGASGVPAQTIPLNQIAGLIASTLGAQRYGRAGGSTGMAGGWSAPGAANPYGHGRQSVGVNPALGGMVANEKSPYVQVFDHDSGYRAALAKEAWDHDLVPDERDMVNEAQARQEAILQMLLQMAAQQGMGGR